MIRHLFHTDLPGNEARYHVTSWADSENKLRLVLTTVYGAGVYVQLILISTFKPKKIFFRSEPN